MREPFSAILDALPAHIALLDHGGTVVAVNNGWRRFSEASGGSPVATGTGSNYLGVCDRSAARGEADAAQAAEAIRRVLHGSSSHGSLEYACQTPRGLKWFRLTVTPLDEQGGRGAVVMHLDITERHEADAEARRTAETLAGIVRAQQEIASADLPAPELVRLMAERARHLTGATAAVAAMADGDETQFEIGTGDARVSAGRVVSRAETLFGLAVTLNEVLLCEDTEADPRVNLQASRALGVRSAIVAPFAAAGEVLGTLTMWSDRPRGFGQREASNVQILAETLGVVLERQRSASRLLASAEQYRLLFTHNPQPMWTYDLDTLRFLAVNRAAVEHYGYSEEEFLAMTIRDIRPPEDVQLLERTVWRLPGEDVKRHFGMWRHRRKAGDLIDVEISSDTVVFDGRLARLVLAHDVTEKIHAADRIAEQAALLDKANDVIIVRDLENRLLFWNPSAERVFGWSRAEALQQSAREVLAADPMVYDDAIAALLEHGEWRGELQKRTKSGGMVTMSARWTLLRDEEGRPRSVLAIETDVTDRKRVEAQALRAQRMESIGTLAGGIAHDLNNVLAPIMMAVALLEDEVKGEEGRELLNTLMVSAQRGADLVKQVLSFARGVDGERIAVHLAPLVRDLLKVVQDTFPKTIRLRFSTERDLWSVLGDATQLHQVLLNLCVNARDAMPQGGTLGVSLQNLVLDETYTAMNDQSAPGSYVMVEIADSGTGIPAEVRERIFEPFFTTKEFGKGTGLGLSTSLAIVRSHGGFINLYTEVGEGTRFKVYLPALTSHAPSAAAPADKVPLPVGNGELVLVVDDEESIREVVRRTLARFGYRVMLAVHGAEALGLYAEHRRDIAVVITDMAMPIMDGRAMIVALRTMNPDVPIIGCSGLELNDGLAQAMGAGVTHFIPKPYTAEAILTTLHQVLHPGS